MGIILKHKYNKIFTAFLLILASFIVLTGCIDIDDKGNISILFNIIITQEPYKTTYYVNEQFDSAGLVVTACYLDDSTKKVTDYTLSKPDMSTSGTKTVNVIYLGKTADFNITVNPAPQGVTLSSIEVTQNPVKTSYYVNETFNPSGLVVTANYSDGTSKQVNDYSLSTPVMSTAGTKTITVTYEDKTAVFNISVTADEGALGVIIY